MRLYNTTAGFPCQVPGIAMQQSWTGRAANLARTFCSPWLLPPAQWSSRAASAGSTCPTRRIDPASARDPSGGRRRRRRVRRVTPLACLGPQYGAMLSSRTGARLHLAAVLLAQSTAGNSLPHRQFTVHPPTPPREPCRASPAKPPLGPDRRRSVARPPPQGALESRSNWHPNPRVTPHTSPVATQTPVPASRPLTAPRAYATITLELAAGLEGIRWNH